MRISSTITLILSLIARTSPYSILLIVYNQLWLLYFATIGWHMWTPAWPVWRTRWILLLTSVPVWAGVMALYLLWERFQRSKHYEQLPIELDVRGENVERPSPRRRRVFLGFYLILVVMGVFLGVSYQYSVDTRYKSAVREATRRQKASGYANGEKIYIAAMFYNNHDVIPYWTEEILKVILYLGVENVYVSIVESYSTDNTPQLLEDFDSNLSNLGVTRSIKIRDTSLARPNSMETAPARIEYLASVRNLAMQPLSSGNIGAYDTVLFSNDIFIEAESVIELLNTKQGIYDMVCGLDLSYWGLYDSWVTRDSHGRIVSSLWPYFQEDAGMEEVMHDEPVPVFTCWNGIAAIKADPFLPIELRKEPSSYPTPLQFRASNSSECFSSESFLLPYDLRRVFNMTDIYLNPRVINAYKWKFYVWFKYVARHWAVRWWMQHMESRSAETLNAARTVMWRVEDIWTWDGGECQPWT